MTENPAMLTNDDGEPMLPIVQVVPAPLGTEPLPSFATSAPPPPMALAIGTYVHHNQGIIEPSLGLSIAQRAERMHRHLGFDPRICAHQVNAATLRMYSRDCYAYLEYAGTVEGACYPATFARWINALSRQPKPGGTTGYAAATINRMASAVRAVWKEAGSQGYVHPLVARAFGEVEGASERALKGNQRPHSQVDIKPEAMREMVELAQGEQLLQLRNRAILLTLASTGLRVETFRQLTQSQIVRREEDWAVRIRSKNEVKAREVPMSDEAYQAIGTWLAARPTSSRYLFTSFAGGRSQSEHPRLTDRPLSAKSIWQLVKRCGAAVGLVDQETLQGTIKPHDFRRFVGKRLIKTRGVKQAQVVLGHKHPSTTLHAYDIEEPDQGATNHLF